jgi:hypothetical protein
VWVGLIGGCGRDGDCDKGGGLMEKVSKEEADCIKS